MPEASFNANARIGYKPIGRRVHTITWVGVDGEAGSGVLCEATPHRCMVDAGRPLWRLHPDSGTHSDSTADRSRKKRSAGLARYGPAPRISAPSTGLPPATRGLRPPQAPSAVLQHLLAMQFGRELEDLCGVT